MLILFLILFVGLTLELGLRMLVPLYPDPFFSNKVSKVFYIPKSKRPNEISYLSTSLLSGETRLSLIQSNNLGFRSRNATEQFFKGCRIGVVGSSFVLAPELHEDETIPHVLESNLKRKVQHTPFEVLSAAQAGGDTRDFLPQIIHQIVHLHPKILIVQIGLNEVLSQIQGSWKYLYEPRVMKNSIYTSLLSCATELYLFRVLYSQITRKKSFWRVKYENQKVVHTIDYKEQDNFYRKGSKVHNIKFDSLGFLDNLLSIIALCKGHSINLVFLWVSGALQEILDKNVTLVTDVSALKLLQVLQECKPKVESLCVKNNVTFLDVDNWLSPTSEYWLTIQHCNTKGAATIANQLASHIELLLQRGL